ncbi:MAG: PHP domain-containing protein, partial [Myxococcales bacterium]|nr:PHP domain-containing protein [Myxococcales bacterium]
MARLENPEIAALFQEMADLLQIQGGDRRRIDAFRRSARIIEGLPLPAAVLRASGELAALPGVGEGTLRRIDELLKRRSCDDLDALRRAVPLGLRELLKVRGVGPAMVRNVHQHLGVATLDELEAAVRSGAIETVPRMGPALARRVLAGVEAYRRRRGQLGLAEAQRLASRWIEELGIDPQVGRVVPVGALRRWAAVVDGIELLFIAEGGSGAGDVADRLCALPEVEAVLRRDGEGVEVSLANAVRVRLWWATAATVGAALLWYTGSPRHRAQLCELAERRGLTLSAAGLFDAGGALLRADDETAMLEALGLPPIPAVLREGRGELEAAEGLPSLIEAADLRGDLHMHSRDSDGRETVAEMAARARALGLDYIAITDHSRALTVAGGLDEPRLLDQAARIRALPQGDGEPRVLAGIEVDILRDGSLDLDPSVLAGLDWVVASVHQWTRMSRAEMTVRVIRAIESGVVDCIGHPTGRRPGRRDAYELDLDAVIEAAAAHDV